MSRFRLAVEAQFEAAHHLRSYRGAPETPHGHSWRVTIELAADKLDAEGMAFDFVPARAALLELVARFDHRDLNSVEPFDRISPTTEQLAIYFCEEMQRRLPAATRALGDGLGRTRLPRDVLRRLRGGRSMRVRMPTVFSTAGGTMGLAAGRVAAAALLVLLGACSSSPAPVAELAVQPAELRLPFPGFETVQIVLTPREALPAGADPQLFLHLLDEPGSVLRTFDLPVPGEWSVGRAISFSARIYQSALGEPLGSGSYVLTAGLYSPGEGRFALSTGSEAVARLEYAVATVTVPPAGESLPALRFSSGWLPATPGQDRQVLARRALEGGGPATFQIGPLAAPGQLLLRLGPAPAAIGRLEVAAGFDSARVRLRSSCGGVEAELSGEVSVETLLDVPSAQPDGKAVECDVELAPNFAVRSSEDGKLRSVAVEVIAWRPGATEESQ